MMTVVSLLLVLVTVLALPVFGYVDLPPADTIRKLQRRHEDYYQRGACPCLCRDAV